MNKTLKILIAIVLALTLGILIVVETALLLPGQFDHLYLGELADKYQRLRSFDDENKIIIIGGSSVAFGIKSPLIEANVGMPVVNFGLYGPLGTTIMMDLTRGHINEGDIVILAPETDHQTMSMYFNGEGMWQSCDSDLTMLLKVRSHNWGEMLGSFWQFAQRKFMFYRYGKPEPDGVYDHDSFDDYGDIIFTREQPTMDDWFDTEVLVDLDTSIIDDDYIDYVNGYIDYCQRRGATVYWSWPPMNELAVQQDEAGILTYATYVREHIRCQIISDITDYIMDAGYFYDTNYHVTDRGAIVHSSHLIQDLENVMGDGSLVRIEMPPPPVRPNFGPSGEMIPSGEPGGMLPPAQTDDAQAETEDAAEAEPTPVPTPEVKGSSADAALFTYDYYNNEGLILTGVTDEGKNRESLEVPWEIDGMKVLAIEENCFAGCDNLRGIYIQSNVERIMQGAFDGCDRLAEIHVDSEGGSILVPGTGLFDNVPGRTKVCVPADKYGSFIADYFWGNYIDRITRE